MCSQNENEVKLKQGRWLYNIRLVICSIFYAQELAVALWFCVHIVEPGVPGFDPQLVFGHAKVHLLAKYWFIYRWIMNKQIVSVIQLK